MALFRWEDYIKIDCDKCGNEVFIIEKIPDGIPYEVKKAFKVYCTECINKNG